MLNLNISNAKCLKAKAWEMKHRQKQCRYFNFKTQSLGRKKIVKRMPSINHFNKLCLFGEYAKESFPNMATPRASTQIVHINVCSRTYPKEMRFIS